MLTRYDLIRITIVIVALALGFFAVFATDYIASGVVLIFVVALLVYLLFIKKIHAYFDRIILVQHEHRLLLESVQQYPMPFAVYDTDDRLVVWNEAYSSIYANAFAGLAKLEDASQLYYSDLIRSNAPANLSGQALEDYIEQRSEEQRKSTGRVVDREYPGKGWFRVSKYRTPSGAIAGIAIDINELKLREAELVKEIKRRKSLELQIRSLAYTDSLTGIANRRSFMEYAEAEFARSKKDARDVSILMLDIDHFKAINDQFGHSTGDEVIVAVSRAATSALRSHTDMIGRIGGEEFAVIMSGTNLAVATEVAQNIRVYIEELNFVIHGESLNVTVSIGVAQLSPNDLQLVDLINRSDESLYCAKNDGRNRVNAA